MTAKAKLATQQEADLVQRFTRGYRNRLAKMIGSLNDSIAISGKADFRQLESRQQDSLRCCLEAVDLVLASHEQFAKLLGSMAVVEPGNQRALGR